MPTADDAATASTSASQTTATQPHWPLIGGAAALGGIALLSLGAAAATRRRRPAEDVTVTPPVVSTPPAFTPTSAAVDRPVTAGGPVPAALVTDAPGRHMAAAYNGPSESNPFLTLRARVRRARFLDKRAAARPAPASAAPASLAPAPRAAPSEQGQTVYVMGKGKAPSFGFRPGWSKG